MKGAHPPANLPPGFAEIWHILHEADLQASSRQVLARRLGVSTHTLQRILVDGNVPQFSDCANRRILRSWTRTLSRLAQHFGHDPQGWLERVGIGWDESIAQVSRAALRQPRPTEARAALTPPAPAAPIPTGDQGVWRHSIPGILTVGLLTRSLFSQPLPGFTHSFLETYARRLLGAVNPLVRIRTVAVDARTLLAGMSGPEPAIHLGVGVLASVARRSLGLSFLPVRGWSLRLSAVAIRQLRQGVDALTWNSAVSAAGNGDHLFIAREDCVARDFLLGQCGVPLTRLLVRASAQPDDLAQDILAAVSQHPQQTLVLVSDEETCRLTLQEIRQREPLDNGLVAEELEAEPAEQPSYPLSIVVRDAAAGSWPTLLECALREEIFGGCHALTAQLYARLLAQGWQQNYVPGPPTPPAAVEETAIETAREQLVSAQAAHSWGQADFAWGRADFSWMTPGFRSLLCRHLIGAVEELLGAQLAALDAGMPPELRRSQCAALAIEQVSLLLAPLARAAGRAPSPVVSVGRIAHCRSCSASLAEEHNRGVSDRYCRHCSDEYGRLRSRAFVQELIARWFEQWQGSLAHDESLRRAEMYMRALPAWNKN